ncbi:hypothetical protein B9Z55_017448 [Caenorhabditis nigoni]|uniref:Receptor L-domain domain-containing protein n=1 Tax=Caenorhabditis nigoni TaxID=1611254 RepID=A0A2G5T9S2_9PELO|nr:hypothetical protein B9Z55_017448 [Caenorhabditis nigoni]
MRFIFLILTISLLHYSTQDIAEDLKHVLESYKSASPECVFNYTEVNSKTIKFFPQCAKVYGIIVINQNTSLKTSQLEKAFQNMTSLYGGLRIENSKMTNLSFFPAAENGLLRVYCKTYGVYIQNNQYLTDVTSLGAMYMYEDEYGEECDYRIENNTKLDAENLCDTGYPRFFMDLKVKGNMKDCGCPGDEITQSSLPNYRNCTKLYRGLNYENEVMINNLDALSNLEVIKGGINIQDSGVHNLSFLENLKTLKVNNLIVGHKMILNLVGNVILERLAFSNLPELKNMDDKGVKLANIKFNHPSLCLTIEEYCFFLENNVSFINLDTKLCEDAKNETSTLNICRFQSMKDLEDSCNLVIGDIIMKSGDEEHFPKLKDLVYLFGSLVIENTTIENMEPLNKLRYILHLNGSNPIVQIVGNQKLNRAYLPGVQNIITNGNRTAIFQNNHPEFFKDEEGSCSLLEGVDTDESKLRMRLDFAGGDCGEKVDFVYRSSSSKIPTLIVFSFVVLTNFA